MTSALPPGIEGDFVHFISGGDESLSWRQYSTKRYYTNAFIVQEGKILLGLKKRGFGKEMFNGFGGKVDPGETSLQAAMRELEEEAGIQAPLGHAGTFLFLTDDVEWAFHIDIYRSNSFTGTISETDEMRPEWFSTRPSSFTDQSDQIPPIPYDKMWGTDGYWLPLVISGRPFVGRADFTNEGGQSRPIRWWFGVQTADTDL